MNDITVEELARRRKAGEGIVLVDIREPHEIEICSLPDAKFIPMRAILADPTSIPRDVEVVLICHAGGRSGFVAANLIARGYDNVRSLRGGLDEWAIKIDPTMQRY
ncbi:MAG TPA: rhodanese-like domain-containing protein [Candidatus Baltobacteraceae bacterium]